MRRNKFLCMIVLLLLLFSGCAQRQSQMGYIGADAAKRAALEAASLSEQEVSSFRTAMGTRDGLDYYQVCFEAAGRSYRYDVDALTGVVIDEEDPAGTDGGQTGWPEPGGPPESDDPGPVVNSPQPVPEASAPVAPGPEPDPYIGEDEARRIALEHAGLEESQVTFVCSLLEFDDGQWEYDVEFYTANYEEYDYEIDALTGAVISFDYDAEYYSPSDGSSAITAEQARQAALARVPGAAENDIRKFKIDDDDGLLLYEGKIIYNGMEYEFEIDAYSGFVREWSAEPFSR